MTRRSQDPTAPATSRTSAAATTDRFGSPEPSVAASEAPGDGQSPGEALRGVKAHFSELAEYISYYLAAKTDGIKVSLRNAGIYAAIGIIGLIAGSAFVTTTVVLFCVGVAAALTRLFGGRVWAGALVTAVLFMALLAGGIWFVMRWMTRASRERTVRKYASRQQHQRANFGTDVKHRAGSPSDPSQ